MNERTFQHQFSTLLDRINELPTRERAMLVGLAEAAAGQESEVTQCLHALEQSIDSMRLCVKYLVFDLEATRRENGCLRRLLSEAEDHSSEQGEVEDDRESFWDDGAD
ncbi:MAG: hypothetical protein GY894_05105 [Planctomycetes bacterium]|jgi:hypothetical protein|nr:hypothetical protein [Planctomycetota bacterium]MCP4838725.1 hypothetical protein [Planctomycetota bacterium]